MWILKEIREEIYQTVFLGLSCVKTLQCSYILDFVFDFTDSCSWIVIKNTQTDNEVRLGYKVFLIHNKKLYYFRY